MRSQAIRTGVAIALTGLLLVFFLPVLPYNRPASGCGGSTYCVGMFPGFSGYQSLGFYLTGWGAVSGGWLEGYVPPVIGAVFLVALPIVVACIWLLAPELAKFSKISRVGLGIFGAALFILADLMLISMLQQAAFPWLIVLVGAFFGASGILMMLLAMHVWPLGLWERKDSSSLR